MKSQEPKLPQSKGWNSKRPKPEELTPKEPRQNVERGLVVAFRPRNARVRNDDHGWPRPTSPADDLGQYERDREADDHRHRITNNLLAFAVLCVIVSCGIWLANTVAEMRAGLDCSLSGRTNCAPIRVPPTERR